MTRAANAAQARARPVDEQITRYFSDLLEQWLKAYDHWPGEGNVLHSSTGVAMGPSWPWRLLSSYEYLAAVIRRDQRRRRGSRAELVPGVPRQAVVESFLAKIDSEIGAHHRPRLATTPSKRDTDPCYGREAMRRGNRPGQWLAVGSCCRRRAAQLVRRGHWRQRQAVAHLGGDRHRLPGSASPRSWSGQAQAAIGTKTGPTW